LLQCPVELLGLRNKRINQHLRLQIARHLSDVV
jgi:hypothetical protein